MQDESDAISANEKSVVGFNLLCLLKLFFDIKLLLHLFIMAEDNAFLDSFVAFVQVEDEEDEDDDDDDGEAEDDVDEGDDLSEQLGDDSDEEDDADEDPDGDSEADSDDVDDDTELSTFVGLLLMVIWVVLLLLLLFKLLLLLLLFVNQLGKLPFSVSIRS